MMIATANRFRASLHIVLALALAIGVCTTGRSSAQSPTYIGRAGCSSATCHGGISGQGPAWNSSLRTWEAQDRYHATAGMVLLNEQSQRMVKALAGTMDLPGVDEPPIVTPYSAEPQEPSPLDDETFRAVLRARCVGCHAPSIAPTGPPDSLASDTSTLDEWHAGVQSGVSCEACHGPASRWLDLHTLAAPAARNTAYENGMLHTEPWDQRTDNCLRCHVGSRTVDGIMRDMNHDLIGAGHPALDFNMSLYHFKLPAHWEVDDSQEYGLAGHQLATRSTSASPETSNAGAQLPVSTSSRRLTDPRERGAAYFELATPQQHTVARLQTLAAATKLALERLEASQSMQAPTPEFAEFNCLACHQPLLPLAGVQARHRLTWNRMYAGHLVPNLGHLPSMSDFLGREGVTTVTTRLKALQQFIDRSLKSAQQAAPPKRLEALADAAALSVQYGGQIDRQLVACWLWTNQLALINASPSNTAPAADDTERLPSADAAELARILGVIDERMGFTAQGPGNHGNLPVPQMVSLDWLQRAISAYRQRLKQYFDSKSNSSATGARP